MLQIISGIRRIELWLGRCSPKVKMGWVTVRSSGMKRVENWRIEIATEAMPQTALLSTDASLAGTGRTQTVSVSSNG